MTTTATQKICNVPFVNYVTLGLPHPVGRQITIHHLPSDVLRHMFSFLVLSQKRSPACVSRGWRTLVIEQTKSSINLNYKSLLEAIKLKLTERNSCNADGSIVRLASQQDLFSGVAIGLRVIRGEYEQMRKLVATELSLISEETEKFLVDSIPFNLAKRASELFKLAQMIRGYAKQAEEYIKADKLKEATALVKQVPDVRQRDLLFERIGYHYVCRKPSSPHYSIALETCDLISTPQGRERAKARVRHEATEIF